MLTLFPRVEGYSVGLPPTVQLGLASGSRLEQVMSRRCQREGFEAIEVICISDLFKTFAPHGFRSIRKEGMPKRRSKGRALKYHVSQHVGGQSGYHRP